MNGLVYFLFVTLLSWIFLSEKMESPGGYRSKTVNRPLFVDTQLANRVSGADKSRRSPVAQAVMDFVRGGSTRNRSLSGTHNVSLCVCVCVFVMCAYISPFLCSNRLFGSSLVCNCSEKNTHLPRATYLNHSRLGIYIFLHRCYVL